MATLHWPNHTLSGSKSKRVEHWIPFIIRDDERYEDGLNSYIRARAIGTASASLSDNDVIEPIPLRPQSIRRIAYDLKDVATWLETRSAHPSLGTVSTADVQPWMLTQLYRDSQILGYWSENFFASGVPIPISPAVVERRTSEGLRCFRWTAKNGFRGRFDFEPTFTMVQVAKDQLTFAYRKEMQVIEVENSPVRVRGIRRQPSDGDLPTPEQLKEFFRAVSPGAPRLMTLAMFETGMRCEEIVENTLLPGRIHKRDIESKTWHQHSSWNHLPYILEYSNDDDKMLGVIPPESFAPPGKSDSVSHRIIGKGPKIRRLHMPKKLHSLFWTHVNGERTVLTNQLPRGFDPPHLFLNRCGTKMSTHAIWEHCDRANQRLNLPTKITPHILRHAFACYFLECAILGQAAQRGIDSENLTVKLIEDYAQTALLILQDSLGHTLASTTQKYLVLFITGRIGVTYRAMHNEFLDALLGDDDD